MVVSVGGDGGQERFRWAEMVARGGFVGLRWWFRSWWRLGRRGSASGRGVSGSWVGRGGERESWTWVCEG